MSTTKPIRRITLFKIPKAEDQENLLEIYKTMPQDAQKVVPLVPLLTFPLFQHPIKKCPS